MGVESRVVYLTIQPLSVYLCALRASVLKKRSQIPGLPYDFTDKRVVVAL